MKLLEITEERSYFSLGAFVQEHDLENLFKELFNCDVESYDDADTVAIKKLLPYVYGNTSDNFTVFYNEANDYIMVFRFKTPKEVYGYNIGDVHARVEDMNETVVESGGIEIDINDDEAEKVLDIFNKVADCGNGISWDDMDEAITRYLKGRTYYQPEIQEGDDIHSFEVYRNPENAIKDFPYHRIKKYNGDDIEGYVFRD